jgi:DNA invertase Pin-like site-specific DNA recombinase
MNVVVDEGAGRLAAPRPAFSAPPSDPRITPRHLARRALIYVRQSSPSQVQRHPESARRQYGLAERAQALGWAAEQIAIIDEDQGKSGAGEAAAHERDGFARLVSAVGLGEVGLILVLEVSRLARNSVEWYRLLELAALAGVLIADEDAIYDPRAFNDRLLLGLRGTISEVELHCLQARLQGARLSKVRRGELPLELPVGYVRGRDGQVELDPDQEVQAAIRTVVEQFERLGTAKAVLQFCREHGLRLPRRLHGGPNQGDLVWVKPTYQAIHLILTNPTYAGAYAYGRRQRDGATAGLGGRGPRRRFALDELEVLLREHHPGYLSWDQYVTNRARLRDNTRQFRSSRGAPRPGQALLQGIVVCGRCGCRMEPHYSSSSPAYICRSRTKRYAEPACQSLTIAHVDAAVSEAFLAVIQPAAVEAVLALGEELARQQTQVARQWQLRLERAQYEAERARRQYDQCEPENRLVARELETRWNDRLRAVAELEEDYRREQRQGLLPLTEAEYALLRSLVSDVPTLWQAAETTMEDRKRLLRCLVRDVILCRDAGAKGAGGRTTIRIGWRGGAWTELDVHRPSTSDRARTATTTLERIQTLAQHLPDERIAEQLALEGRTTRQGLPWTARRVQRLRTRYVIATACPLMPRQAQARGDGLVPLAAAAARLGVVPGALAHWRQRGLLHVEQSRPGSPLWVRLTEQELARLDGTLARQGVGQWTPREAERAWGLDRAALWERARQGEIIGYRMRIGRRWQWRFSRSGDEPARSPRLANSQRHSHYR